MTRQPLVAGLFYPHNPSGLKRQLEECFQHRLGPGFIPTPNETGERNILGLVCPHAGYVYSGPTAAKSYAALAGDGIPKTAIILAPAHYRPGASFAVWTEGKWLTPLGAVPIAEEIASALVEIGSPFAKDLEPHLGFPDHGEHAIEVQLPFLQFVFGQKVPAIVPIAVSSRDLKELQTGGEKLGAILAEKGTDSVIIASCDFTHYEPHPIAERHDREALERLIALDGEGLWETIQRYPTQSDVLVAIPMIEACRRLGATRGEVLGYSTSGEITGDLSQVVGYGAAVLARPRGKM